MASGTRRNCSQLAGLMGRQVYPQVPRVKPSASGCPSVPAVALKSEPWLSPMNAYAKKPMELERAVMRTASPGHVPQVGCVSGPRQATKFLLDTKCMGVAVGLLSHIWPSGGSACVGLGT